MPELRWCSLGRVDYAEARRIQSDLATARSGGPCPDLVLTLEHPPIFTIGCSGAARSGGSVLGPAGPVECVPVRRGGGVTYHGPGQLVIYPVVQLAARGRAVRAFVEALEEALCAACAAFAAPARRRAGFPGVWSADGARKLGSVGLAISRGVTLHGAALNVDPRAERGFDAIDPCGLVGVRVSSIASESSGPAPTHEEVAVVVVADLAHRLGHTVRPTRLRDISMGTDELFDGPLRSAAPQRSHE